MKKIVVLIILVIAMVAAWFFWSGSGGYADHPVSGRNIIAFGDSLIAGVGATPGNDLVSVLARRTGMDIVNAGVSGDTTADGLARLEKDVLQREPKVVIICLGGNDILRSVPAEIAMNNLKEIIRKIHAKEAGVLLLGIKGGVGPFGSRYSEDYGKLASEEKVSFLPDILGGIMGDASLMSDEIHPNDKGYALIADKAAPLLRKIVQP